MATTDVRAAIAWQARHSEEAGAPITARVILAELAILDSGTATGERMANWPGLSLADAMPLRVAARCTGCTCRGPILGSIGSMPER